MTKPQLTASDQDHLRAMYLVGGGEQRVPMGLVAARVGHSAAAVTAAAKRLQAMGLVAYERYRGVRLTDAGLRIALEVVRHHRLLESYLVEFLGYKWSEVHEEADRLEHAISETLEQRIAARISNASIDPHGEPIPNEELVTAHVAAQPLTLFAPGASVVVRRVRPAEGAILTYLAEIGLVPGATVTVVDRLPFEGPLVVEVAGRRHHLGLLVSDSVFVSSPDGQAPQRAATKRATSRRS